MLRVSNYLRAIGFLLSLVLCGGVAVPSHGIDAEQDYDLSRLLVQSPADGIARACLGRASNLRRPPQRSVVAAEVARGQTPSGIVSGETLPARGSLLRV